MWESRFVPPIPFDFSLLLCHVKRCGNLAPGATQSHGHATIIEVDEAAGDSDFLFFEVNF